MSDTASANGPKPEKIMRYAWDYAAPLILEAGVRLGVFDELEGSPKSVDELTKHIDASPRGLRLIMNALVGLELLTKDTQDHYALTAESAKFLVRSKPSFLGGFLMHTSSQLIPRWLNLTEIARTGKPVSAVNQEDEGAEFFEQFVEDLFALNRPTAEALADHLDLSGDVSVLDLAAGSGVWSITLAEKSPMLRATIVDWAKVIPVAKRVTERHSVRDRFSFIEGDLLEADFGANHNIATLGHILHSEGEDRSRALIKKTFDALAPGGTIVIAEWLVNDERTGPLNGLLFAVNMLVNTDEGDTFSFTEIEGWLNETGFTAARELEVPGPSPLILAEKPR